MLLFLERHRIGKCWPYWHLYFICLVGWGCRIHRMFLCSGVRPHQNNRCPMAQLAGAVEYTECFSAGEQDHPHQWVPWGPVGWGCRNHWLHLGWGVRTRLQRVSWYDTNQSEGDVSVMQELWRMWSTSSLPLFPGPLSHRFEETSWGLIYGSNTTKRCTYAKLNCLFNKYGLLMSVVDLGQNRLSGISQAGCTCVNKRKQMRGLNQERVGDVKLYM